jgi:enoyl-CoA hydratase
MNNPSMRNAFTRPLHHAMIDIWAQIEADREARAVILTGAGRAFSPGGDVANFIRNHDDPDHRRESLRGARHLINAMLAFRCPLSRPSTVRLSDSGAASRCCATWC